MIIRLLYLVFLLGVTTTSIAQPKTPATGEIMYHVFQRSFYDSNGDSHGDLNGLRQKLGYLKELGVTSILLLPLYEADCYHNYFANDFESIDPEFGTLNEYLSLVRAIHAQGMKVYMDMETQYVTEKHAWWQSAVGNLNSPFSDYLLFDDSAHNTPATMIFGLRVLNGYDGRVIKVTTVNLKSKQVLDYNRRLFGFFLDPNQDGRFDDGVDGFRLDHAMDRLDDKPTLIDLFASFWKPLVDDLKKINPGITIIAEQADWTDYGFDYFHRAGVDRMFGFELRQAILSFDKSQLIHKADTTLRLCPPGKQQIVFLENHDIDRLASTIEDRSKQKVAAALMFYMGGVPAIYYGQEIGMQGKNKSFGNTDGNNISVREAFDWYRSGEGLGTAMWYKRSGPWWDEVNNKANDGISLEEERADSGSLFNYYRTLIQVRQAHPALSGGQYSHALNDNERVFSFTRAHGPQRVLVIVNLSNEEQTASLLDPVQVQRSLFGSSRLKNNRIRLLPYEVTVFELK